MLIAESHSDKVCVRPNTAGLMDASVWPRLVQPPASTMPHPSERSDHILQRRRLIVLVADRNRVSVGRSTITIEAAAAPHLSLNNAATHRPPLYQPFSWQRQARDVAAKLKQMGIDARTLAPGGSTEAGSTLIFSSACFQIRLKAQNYRKDWAQDWWDDLDHLQQIDGVFFKNIYIFC